MAKKCPCCHNSINIGEIFVYGWARSLCRLFPTLLNDVILQIKTTTTTLEYCGKKRQFKLTAQMLSLSLGFGNSLAQGSAPGPLCPDRGLKPSECGRGWWPHHEPTSSDVYTSMETRKGVLPEAPCPTNTTLLFIHVVLSRLCRHSQTCILSPDFFRLPC